MECIACKLPIDSSEVEYYDCSYDDIAHAARTNCPRCSFVFECIRTGAADVDLSEISKVHVWEDYYCELYLTNGCTILDMFTENVQDGSPPHLDRVRNHIPGATDSETTVATIHNWITECTTTHDACHREIQHAHHSVVYPKRLLDLNEESVILRENIQPARYACLSHCWGVDVDVARTTTHNLRDFMINIPWGRLTATFQDAISTCRRLGIFYLWVDSLCIIQDSKDDWKDQASKMADIYENSFITIAATKSKSSSEGCFAECDQKYLSKLVPGYPSIYVRQRPPLFPTYWDQLDGSDDWPLLNRGWIYQEMRLSRRTLHFCANEVVWRCQTVQRSESGSKQDFSDDGSYRNMQYQYVPYSILQENPRYLWYRTVQEYSRLQLTFGSDKMPALAGLSKRMEAIRPGDRYLVGLWEKTLLFDLLWFVWPIPVPRRQRTAKFPSWSWASVKCQVMWSDLVDITLDSVRVEEVRFVTTGPSHLGEVSEATITIRGPLIDESLLLSQWWGTQADLSHDNATAMEELYRYDYKADCLPADTSAARSKPDTAGFIVPIGVSMTNHVFVAIHVRVRPGTKYYERIGYVQISHPSIKHRTKARNNRNYNELRAQRAQIDRDTVRLKELLEALPTSSIVLI